MLGNRQLKKQVAGKGKASPEDLASSMKLEMPRSNKVRQTVYANTHGQSAAAMLHITESSDAQQTSQSCPNCSATMWHASLQANGSLFVPLMQR